MNGHQGSFGCDQTNALRRGERDILRVGGRTRGVVLSVSVCEKTRGQGLSTAGLASTDLREREH